MREKDRIETEARYRQRWVQYGQDARTLGWDKGCQSVRFEAAFEGLRPEEYSSVLDVGCGFGDLLTFLRSKGWSGDYVGIDIVPEFIEEARSRHTLDRRAKFERRDIQENPLAEKWQMAIALGIFNHRLTDHQTFVSGMVNAMWRATKSVVVCDFLSMTANDDHRRLDLSYQDPCEAYELGRRYTKRAMIHHAYMPFEFQLKIWHDDSFQIPAPVFQPYEDLASKTARKAKE